MEILCRVQFPFFYSHLVFFYPLFVLLHFFSCLEFNLTLTRACVILPSVTGQRILSQFNSGKATCLLAMVIDYTCNEKRTRANRGKIINKRSTVWAQGKVRKSKFTSKGVSLFFHFPLTVKLELALFIRVSTFLTKHSFRKRAM